MSRTSDLLARRFRFWPKPKPLSFSCTNTTFMQIETDLPGLWCLMQPIALVQMHILNSNYNCWLVWRLFGSILPVFSTTQQSRFLLERVPERLKSARLAFVPLMTSISRIPGFGGEYSRSVTWLPIFLFRQLKLLTTEGMRDGGGVEALIRQDCKNFKQHWATKKLRV